MSVNDKKTVRYGQLISLLMTRKRYVMGRVDMFVNDKKTVRYGQLICLLMTRKRYVMGS